INKQNFCYGVLLRAEKEKEFAFVPVEYSFYSGIYPVDYLPFMRRDYTLPYPLISALVDDLNAFIVALSVEKKLFVLEYDYNEKRLAKMTPEERFAELYQNVIPLYSYIGKQKALVLRGKTDTLIGFISNDLY